MPPYAREPLSPELVSEMVPLIVRHFVEVAHFKDIKVEPDFDRYMAVEAAGLLRIYTAREHGQLIGYSVFVVTQHPHFRGVLQANEELLFLDPDHRRGAAGSYFIKFCDEQLAAEGVNVIYHTVSPARDYSPILLSRGYSLCDHVYARRLS